MLRLVVSLLMGLVLLLVTELGASMAQMPSNFSIIVDVCPDRIAICFYRQLALSTVRAILSRLLGSCSDASKVRRNYRFNTGGLVEFDSLGSRGRLTTKGGV